MLTNQVLETVLGIWHTEIHKSHPGCFSSLHFSDQNFINIPCTDWPWFSKWVGCSIFIHLLWQYQVAHYLGGLSMYSRMVLSMGGPQWREHPISEGDNCVGQHSIALFWSSLPAKLLKVAGRICLLAFSSQEYSPIFVQSFRVFRASSHIWLHLIFTNSWTHPGFRYDFSKFKTPWDWEK